ncbi:MAG: hypothetical protein JRG80_06345 [Deltaproteobacteria bacterium]|nr:hypothetical protein [Deltaproteobacteria bacterium]MBW2398877.1 hypothetical protein [Deltaproteobacteria bacterium]
MSVDESGDARAALRAAWDEMLEDLARARDAIDQPERMPAPASDRNLAEGYRYLMGYVHGAVERAFFEDPHFPFVRNVLQLVNKATIDNADAIYFAAPIDGRDRYVVRGHAADHRHWRGEIPAAAGRIAPQYLIFEVSAGELAGDSGSLAELRPGVKAQTGRLDSTAIEVEADGHFEILLAPQRPAGYTGNFIATHRRTRRPSPDDPEGSLDRHANYLSGRQLFGDWEREDAVLLTIERVGSDALQPAPLDPATAAAQLRRFGKLVANQMAFWNEFYTVLLETYGKRDGSEGERFMPRNAFNAPNAASSVTGGGQSTNLYAGGVYELEPDEALVIETKIPVPPQYIGFHLSNLWGESHDFANHQSSLNGFQSEFDGDGRLRWVIAHRDPGIPNWVDTTGHREGFMAPRWAYTEAPPQDRWPTISATKVRFDEIRDHLPANVRTVAPEERAERIHIRREHVQRRYRAF